MQDAITDADLQVLLATNPLAAEQLRRIVAERHRDELRAEVEALTVASNGVGIGDVIDKGMSDIVERQHGG